MVFIFIRIYAILNLLGVVRMANFRKTIQLFLMDYEPTGRIKCSIDGTTCVRKMFLRTRQFTRSINAEIGYSSK